MQKHKLSAMLVLILALTTVARADRVTSDYDHSVDFSRYKTFMWVHEPDGGDAFMKERIMNFVKQELTARGFREVKEGADMGVGANIATEERHIWDTYYSGSGWGWTGWSTTEMRTYEVGTLTVDLFDAASQKLIWQGIGIDKVSSKPAKQTKDNDKLVERMFKDFPGFAR